MKSSKPSITLLLISVSISVPNFLLFFFFFDTSFPRSLDFYHYTLLQITDKLNKILTQILDQFAGLKLVKFAVSGDSFLVTVGLKIRMKNWGSTSSLLLRLFYMRLENYGNKMSKV